MIEIPFKYLDGHARAPLYASPGDAGADLFCTEPVVLEKRGGTALVSTGIALAIPEGYVGLVHPRSGLAVKHGVTVLNAPGTIDSGYRGEVKVILINHGPEHVGFLPGDRIAQLVIQEVEQGFFSFVPDPEELPESVRGEGGFGSTG